MSDESGAGTPALVEDAEGETQRIQVLLRPLRLQDLDGIQALYLKLHAELHAHDPLKALCDDGSYVNRQMRAFRQQMLTSQQYIAHVAEYDDALIGYIAGTVKENSPIFHVRQYGVVLEWYVEPSVRGRGVGGQLLQNLLQDLYAAGVKYVEGTNLPAGEGGQRYVKELGFETKSVRQVLRMPE